MAKFKCHFRTQPDAYISEDILVLKTIKCTAFLMQYKKFLAHFLKKYLLKSQLSFDFHVTEKCQKRLFYEWLIRDKLMNSPIVTGNLFSEGNIPTTPKEGMDNRQ